MNAPNPSGRPILSIVTPWIVPTVLGALAIGLVRSFDLNAPMRMVIMTAIFLTGAVLGHVMFFAEDELRRVADGLLARMFGPGEGNSAPSLLRQGHFLVLIPLVGLWGLTSTRAPFGLGLIWGLSLQYVLDTWRYWAGESTPVARRYFPAALDSPWLIVTVIAGFFVYFAVLTVGVLRV